MKSGLGVSCFPWSRFWSRRKRRLLPTLWSHARMRRGFAFNKIPVSICIVMIKRFGRSVELLPGYSTIAVAVQSSDEPRSVATHRTAGAHTTRSLAPRPHSARPT